MMGLPGSAGTQPPLQKTARDYHKAPRNTVMDYRPITGAGHAARR